MLFNIVSKNRGVKLFHIVNILLNIGEGNIGVEAENPLGITRVTVNFRLKISSALTNKMKRDTLLNLSNRAPAQWRKFRQNAITCNGNTGYGMGCTKFDKQPTETTKSYSDYKFYV
jgi:hypothetical protein